MFIELWMETDRMLFEEEGVKRLLEFKRRY